MPKTHTVDQYNACLPTRLRELLRDRKITQSKLSSDVGILNQSISQYLDGSVTPPLEKLIRLADYFNVSIDYLLGRTEVASTSIKKKEICKTTGLTAKSVDILMKLKYDPKFQRSLPSVLSIINTCIHAANKHEVVNLSFLLDGRKVVDGVKSQVEYDINYTGSSWCHTGAGEKLQHSKYNAKVVLGATEAKRYACRRITEAFYKALTDKFIDSEDQYDDTEVFGPEDEWMNEFVRYKSDI